MPKVLLVCTSADSLGAGPTGLWLSELAEPYYTFQAAGVEMVIASTKGGPVPIDGGSMGGPPLSNPAFFTEDAKKFMHDHAAFSALSHSKKIDDVDLADVDAIYLTGGHGCCTDFAGPAAAGVKKAVEAMYAAGKLVAADCHGPYGLIDCVKPNGEPLVKGLEVTAFTNLEEEQAGAKDWVTGAGSLLMQDKFTEQGAVFKEADPWSSNVVVCGNLITAQNPQSGIACAQKVTEVLKA